MGKVSGKSDKLELQKQKSKDEKKFFIQSDNLPLWQVCQEISTFFEKNVVVYQDCKDLKVSCNIRDLDLKHTLDLISWLTGIEWYEKDGIYYVGGNKDYIEVLDNPGIDQSITQVFQKTPLKIVEDKIVITGTEREVKRIADAVRKLQKKDFVTLRVWGYEVSNDVLLRLGLNIDKTIKYAFSWEGMISNQFNPIQTLAVSLAMSVEANKQSDDLRLILDTMITSASGKTQSFTVGEAIDREIYSTNSESGRSYVSGYNTVQTGYVLDVSAFKYDGDKWKCDFVVSNTAEITSLRRTNMILKNCVVIGEGPSLIGRIIKNSEILTVSKGIPFLCDIPFIGYLFKISSERQVTRNVLFFCERVQPPKPEPTKFLPPSSFPFLNISNGLKDLNKAILK